MEIFFEINSTWILLFSVEYYIIKLDIIEYYLWPNSTAVKLCKQKSECVDVKKNQSLLYIWVRIIWLKAYQILTCY